MGKLVNKIDFAVVLSVKSANPNGDPLNGNRPRETYSGLGEISDVCLKRKIRNRLQDMGYEIFVQSDDRRTDKCRSLKERVDSCEELKAAGKNKELFASIACSKWIDVRSFGQVFAFGKTDDDSSVSIGIRGPVSLHPAFSVSPIQVTSLQITKSVNAETGKDPDKKGSDTKGMKQRVAFGVYVFYGSISTQLAEKTGFSHEDGELIKEALRTLFVNDSSSARPEGSMEVVKVYWWTHNNEFGQYSAAKVHRTLKVELVDKSIEPKDISDYNIYTEDLDDLTPEVYDGV